MKAILMALILSANTYAISQECKDATVKYEGAVETYGANTAVASLGWQAYEVCKQELNSYDQALVEVLKKRCLENNDSEGSMYRAFEAGCSLRAVEYFLYSQAEQ
ncbi:hypothetical protein BIY24_15665 [Halobacteriovorax marinus]|uniref:hypothetical protein n=1 Tax=Halobacteriovorax marinus TaxID=97084 RepID=UPI000BC3027D|nr:hypothetical protein [Halobacteriovorax marinus]ATH09328.1 hypothetical protein BIY24_15665 [Halobacteriovorax marinus]